MAYTPCETSKVLANAKPNCDFPAIEGIKVVAVAFAKEDILSVVRGTGASKNSVSGITLKEGAKTFVIEAGGESPFADTTEEFDAATRRFNKTVVFTAPAHGAAFSAGVVEPILKNRDGYVVVMQRKDENGDCAFPIIGLEMGAVGTAGTLNYTDTASAGCYVLTLTETGAQSAEVNLFSSDYQTSKELFEGLVGKSY